MEGFPPVTVYFGRRVSGIQKHGKAPAEDEAKSGDLSALLETNVSAGWMRRPGDGRAAYSNVSPSAVLLTDTAFGGEMKGEPK